MSVTFYDDLINNGTVQISEGSTAVYFGAVSGNSFTGSGTTFVEGDLSPGFSPGAMSFGGDVVLGTASTTQIELAGITAGEYDQVLISGVLEVSGELVVQLLEGFSPKTNDLFNILDFGSVSGSFGSISLPDLSTGMSWDHSDLLTTGQLRVLTMLLLGDFNRDGTVNAVDIDLLRIAINTGSADPIYDVNGGGLDGTDFNYQVQTIIGSAFGDADLNKQINFRDFVSLSTNFGSSGTGWAQGNFNLDNITNFADFVALANNYGTDLSSGTAGTPVPEPASLVLLSLAVGFVARRRRGVDEQ